MAYPRKTPAAQFHVDCSPEAKSRSPRSTKRSVQNEVGVLRGGHFHGVDHRRDRPADFPPHRNQARSPSRKLRQPMKTGMIFARKTTWRSRLDLEYLDETSSRKVSARQEHDGGPKRTRPLRQFADYASKETLGQVHAGGFLHHLILVNQDGTRTAPSQLTNDEPKRRISEAWFEHIRKFPTSSKNPVVQHRLVFSMSREMQFPRPSEMRRSRRAGVAQRPMRTTPARAVFPDHLHLARTTTRSVPLASKALLRDPLR